MAVKRKQADTPQEQESTLFWTPQMEAKLLETMLSYKPAGLAKHFNMAIIHYKLVQQEGFKDLTSQHIWEHLGKFFDLEKADSVERPFLQRNSGEVEFCLPIKDFADAMAEMKKGSYIKVETPTIRKGDKAPASSTPSVSSTDGFPPSKDVTDDVKASELDTPRNPAGAKRGSNRGTPASGNKRRKN